VHLHVARQVADPPLGASISIGRYAVAAHECADAFDHRFRLAKTALQPLPTSGGVVAPWR
jgi:hypothetical protein